MQVKLSAEQIAILITLATKQQVYLISIHGNESQLKELREATRAMFEALHPANSDRKGE